MRNRISGTPGRLRRARPIAALSPRPANRAAAALAEARHDPPPAARLRAGDSRLCDDASRQPRDGPRLSRDHGADVVLGGRSVVVAADATAALWQLRRALCIGLVRALGAADAAVACGRAAAIRARLRDPASAAAPRD